MVSPTTRADLRYGVPGRNLICSIDHSTRRCTGLSPSRTSGMARAVITDSAYAMNESLISCHTGTSTMRAAASAS